MSLRWRLVGPDGHPITGRVDFTIAAPATTRPENAAAVPEVAVTFPSNADGAITADSSVADRDGGAFSTPSALSVEQMDALAVAIGAEFDQMWLGMMIAHHEGAVSQSETVKANGSNPDVLLLANQIIAAQQGEIAETQALLGS